ncbi:MAG: type III pantothenate kinase [Gammaproteobacteria bacterium]|nr:type III pantothenate kinase [Gammaproteobacteria bacterium]
MRLLIDIGNSRIKWALSEKGATLLHSGVQEQDLPAMADLLKQLHQETAITSATVVCVGSEELYRQIVSIIKKLTDVTAQRFVSSQYQAKVKNAYRDYQSLGADRWAALIAGYQLYFGPLLICDCGTAVTIDIIDAGGRHVGGYILPGLAMARRSLHAGTTNLPQVRGGDLIPASDSVSAVSNGTLLQLVAAIEQVAFEYGQPNCVLTGGDAVFVGSFLGIPFHHDPDLVLKGLAIAGTDN